MEHYHVKRIAVILIALLSSFPGWSYKVSGKIVCENNPLSGIEVRILDPEGDELGQSTTGSDGVFTIDDIGPEKIVVEITGDGYVPRRLGLVTGNSDLEIGSIGLERSVTLDEVTVTAKSMIRTPEKTMIYTTPVERERAAGAFNMLTILSYKAPQIQVNESERTLTISGDTPQILVNGIKRPMSFISSIKADAIERIDFTTSPDIRFGTCYLNIITKRPTEGGWFKAEVTGAVTTPRYFYNGLADYTRGRNDFMLYYNGGYRHGRKEYVDEREQYSARGRVEVFSMEGMPSSTLDRYHDLFFYYTRILSARSRLEVNGGVGLHDNDRDRSDHVTDLTGSYDRDNRRGYTSTAPSMSLYWYLKATGRTVFEVNALGSYMDYSMHRDLTYTTGYASRLSSKNRTWYVSAEALWKQRLPFASLNTGISMSYNDSRSRYLIDGVGSIQDMSSTGVKAYTSMSGEALTIGYRLSAGVNYYKVEQEMVSPTVMASLQRNLGEHFSLSYNFRYNPSMPSLSSYNGTPTPVNELMYRVGSDSLKVQRNMSHSLQLDFSRRRLYVSLRGSVTHNLHPLVTDYTYQDDPGKELYGFFLERTGNARYYLDCGVDLNVGLSNLWDFLSFSASAGWGESRLKADGTFRLRSWHLNVNMGLYWRGWQLNMTGNNLLPSWSMQGGSMKMRRWPYTSLALYKKLGNWNLHVAWNNILSRYGGRYREETLSSVVRQSSDFRMNDQGNMIEIGVQFQFTTGKLLRTEGRSLNLSDGRDSGLRWDY